MDPRYDVLTDAARLAREFVDGLAERPVGASAGIGELRERLGLPLTAAGEDPRTVIAELAADVEPGLVASAGPRYFGFVIGGALPAAVAADWLTSAWDQNGGGAISAPALTVVEAVAADWVRELLGLPAHCGVGFVTGCQMAHVTCLAAARHAVLADAGWNVEVDGLQGAPPLRVVAGANAHITVARACRILGLGAETVRIVPADGEGRMLAVELAAALGEHDGPQIVCAQAGEVNSGAFDPLAEIVRQCRAHGAWCHVDGAFGLWAAVSPSRRHLLDGFEGADSWATDAHKWLNVPYDCGIALVADAARQRGAMASTADYIPANDSDVPWGVESTPEFSRRARAVPLYAALRSLGRDGVRGLVDGCCDQAERIAARLAAHDDVEILNDVVLNQVLVRFGGSDDVTERVLDRVQQDGTCWASGSRWHGGATVMRISVSGWQTTAADADRSADAILAALRATTR
ncbi:MAG TPA: aminotransferase class V-fold PLP-dependent enzyme [Solirubrobacteraceae bacterium]|nr:aminotransferase class V-fold PLP-dependent enzyme [Solirubrobacteraceae bacterium]